MIQLFRTQKIYSLFWLISLLLIIQFNRFARELFKGDHTFTLFNLEHSLFSIFVSTIVVYIAASLINNVCNRFRLFESGSYLPAALTMIYSSFITDIFKIGRWMIAIILFVLIFNKLYKAYQKNKPEPNYFDTSFLLGIISILYPHLIFLWFALAVSIFIMSILKIRYFFISIFAFTMPWLFCITYLLMTNQASWLEQQIDFIRKSFTNFQDRGTFFFSFSSLFFLVSGLLCILYWTFRSHILYHIQKPILLSSSVFFAVAFILVLLFLPIQNFTIIALIIPLSILSSYYFYHTQSKLAKLLFISSLGFALAYPWIQELNLFL